MIKRTALFSILYLMSAACPLFAGSFWRSIDPAKTSNFVNPPNVSVFRAFAADETAIKAFLFSLAEDPTHGKIIDLPMPDGTSRNFVAWSSPMMEPGLAFRYPEIKTFTAVAVDDQLVTAKLDFTLYGFHAMIFGTKEISFIDPADNNNTGNYFAHYKRDEVHTYSQPQSCVAQHFEPVVTGGGVDMTNRNAFRTSNGYQLRTYRLALACSHQYATAATSIGTPRIYQVLSKMTTTMNRVNGVYERELSITMQFVTNEDLLIDTAATGGLAGPDVFSAINSNATECIIKNQIFCDSFIGTANYDIGHVFTTGAGGYSDIGIICDNSRKGRSVTGQPTPVGDGFDIDYVAHEMGHEYGADHTFNASSSQCSGNGNSADAFEPGSGSTIMAYAGICGPDDLQWHSDDYFHSMSLYEIQRYLTNFGNSCGVKTPTNNKLVSVAPFSATYTIPFLTPFELTAPIAVDSVSSSSVTYNWEQWNLGDYGLQLSDTHTYGPIFRSFPSKTSPTRIFPKDTMVLAGVLSNAGTDGWEGEKVPDVARFLTFKLTMRNIFNGNGCFLIPDDSIHLDVVATTAGTGFRVTSQADPLLTYVGNSTQAVTWDVVGTDSPPVNAGNVDIYMSEDDGYTWNRHIGTFPNTGSAIIPLPNPDTTTLHARIKVKGSNNVFFNVNKAPFTVTHGDGTDTTVRIYPVPTHNTLRISSGNRGAMKFHIYNSVGRLVYSDSVNGVYDVAVQFWPRGNYFIKLIDLKGRKSVLKFVID